MKKTVFLSLVAGAIIFAGCGGGGGSSSDNGDGNSTQQPQQTITDTDTTPPIITNQATYTVEEDTNRTITLTTNENNVTFSMNPTPHFTLTDAELLFSAPDYNDTNGANNDYNATVTATDAAGNDTNKTFVFTVSKRMVNATAQVVPVGDKVLRSNGDGRLVGPTGLIWDVNDTINVTYNDAQNQCSAPKRVPLANELLNLINYDKASNANHGSLLEDEFNGQISEYWALEQNGKLLVVNVRNGGVYIENNTTAVHGIKCVEGNSAADHTYSDLGNNIVLDEATQLEWKAFEDRKTIVGDENATNYCAAPWRFPNINELRTLLQSDGTMDNLLFTTAYNSRPAPSCSGTEYADAANISSKQNYIIKTSTTPFYVNVAEVGDKNYVTCVKEH